MCARFRTAGFQHQKAFPKATLRLSNIKHNNPKLAAGSSLHGQYSKNRLIEYVIAAGRETCAPEWHGHYPPSAWRATLTERGRAHKACPTWSRQGCNPAGDLNRRTSRSWYVRGAIIPKGAPPTGRSGKGATCSRRRSSTSADVAAERLVADHVHLVESRGEVHTRTRGAQGSETCALEWHGHYLTFTKS